MTPSYCRAPGLSLALLAFSAGLALAQTPRDRAPINQSADPRLAAFHFRPIGPAAMGGRVDAVAVAATDPNVIYVGFAVGGVFRSLNNATTFEPVFETYGSASIGDIAIDPTNADVVYVGTGEANNRNTSSFGDGMYKSTNGGKTFVNIGLRATQTIARIVIDPRHPQTIYVAALGHLYGPNPDRGIYKSIDGGKSWRKIKFIDDDTGFTELVMDPSNSNVLYAASYQRRRTGCCYNGGGPGSALWKTTDAGATWTKLTGGGLPPGPYGRIALDVSPSNPNVVYAQVEAGDFHLVFPDGSRSTVGTPGMSSPGGDAARYWCNNGAPSAAATAAARGTPKLELSQGGIMRSADGGKHWALMNNCDERAMYFSQVRVDPHSPNTVYFASGDFSKSLDGGKTLRQLDDVHSDQHAMWIDPRNSKHILVGNDGGLNISYDGGSTWEFPNLVNTGTAYVVTADNEHPYNVYIGLQDNGSWGGPSATRGRGGIRNDDWFNLGCVGDGFITAVNWDHPNVVYCEGQDGDIERLDLNTGQSVAIRPGSGPGVPQRGRTYDRCVDGRYTAPLDISLPKRKSVLNAHDGDAYRFNWNTPYILSPHDPDVVYYGGNRLFRSTDRGDNWVASADLTKQIDRCTVSVMGVSGDKPQFAKNDGVDMFGTIVSISESPAKAGVVWAGTDDGNLQVSVDSGRTFTEVSRNLPGLPSGNRYYISRIDASHFDPATAYVAIDGHRSDDLRPYIFVTRDYGKTFTRITTGLPLGNVNVVREDPSNKELLFAGTEFGLFVSLDGGEHWQAFMAGLPTVRVDDILIHPRDRDLVVATHGRSIWIADDITPLEQLTPDATAWDAHLFQPRDAVAYRADPANNPYAGDKREFVGANPPAGASIAYSLGREATGAVTITVADSTGRAVATLDEPRAAGLHKLTWPATATGRGSGGRLLPGTYSVTLTANGSSYTKTLTVLEDRWFKPR
jgi:photosystem II stability/assembly factor-like uncharacterized protein